MARFRKISALIAFQCDGVMSISRNIGWHKRLMALREHVSARAWNLTAFECLDFSVLAGLDEDDIIGWGGAGTVYKM
uniref:Uncharacterized protein n=1 Tax=Physcomitrium patens TaxID=3218 RepID=A0A2K1KIG0_PHYPA|nr:hypothetical protein PHYPA_007249 [Physcomitrium patens]